MLTAARDVPSGEKKRMKESRGWSNHTSSRRVCWRVSGWVCRVKRETETRVELVHREIRLNRIRRALLEQHVLPSLFQCLGMKITFTFARNHNTEQFEPARSWGTNRCTRTIFSQGNTRPSTSDHDTLNKLITCSDVSIVARVYRGVCVYLVVYDPSVIWCLFYSHYIFFFFFLSVAVSLRIFFSPSHSFSLIDWACSWKKKEKEAWLGREGEREREEEEHTFTGAFDRLVLYVDDTYGREKSSFTSLPALHFASLSLFPSARQRERERVRTREKETKYNANKAQTSHVSNVA